MPKINLFLHLKMKNGKEVIRILNCHQIGHN